MSLRHYLQFSDLNREEYEYLFARTRWIKERFKSYQQYWPLVDRTLVMIFEKASTRTRLSFEAGMQQLGGAAIYLAVNNSNSPSRVCFSPIPSYSSSMNQRKAFSLTSSTKSVRPFAYCAMRMA